MKVESIESVVASQLIMPVQIVLHRIKDARTNKYKSNTTNDG
jgi:hypothetical protein